MIKHRKIIRCRVVIVLIKNSIPFNNMCIIYGSNKSGEMDRW